MHKSKASAYKEVIMNDSPDKYMDEHPDEEEEFYEELAQLELEKGLLEIPEEWPLPDWLETA